MSDIYFDDDGKPTAVDCLTPAQAMIDAEEAVLAQDSPSALTIVEKIAATFTRGDSRITELAWRFLLGAEPQSMRRCAARLGISFAAISRRARIISEEFGLRLHSPRMRVLRREIAFAAWRKRKRRAGLSDSPLLMEPETSDQGGFHE